MKELFEYIRDWILYYCGWVRYIHCALHGHNFYHCEWRMTEDMCRMDKELEVICKDCGKVITITIDGYDLINMEGTRRTW